MAQADDVRAAILSAVNAPKEVAELARAIATALNLLDDLGRPKITRITLRPNTPDEEIREMWLVKDGLPYFQMWLDTTGTLWHFFFGEAYFTRKVDLVALPAPIVAMHRRDIQSFMKNFRL